MHRRTKARLAAAALTVISSTLTIGQALAQTVGPDTVSCSGTVVTSSTGSAQCTDGNGNVIAWTVSPAFSVSQLDTTEAEQAFAAGFVLVGMSWGLGKAVGLILEVVRR